MNHIKRILGHEESVTELLHDSLVLQHHQHGALGLLRGHAEAEVGLGGRSALSGPLLAGLTGGGVGAGHREAGVLRHELGSGVDELVKAGVINKVDSHVGAVLNLVYEGIDVMIVD